MLCSAFMEHFLSWPGRGGAQVLDHPVVSQKYAAATYSENNKLHFDSTVTLLCEGHNKEVTYILFF